MNLFVSTTLILLPLIIGLGAFPFVASRWRRKIGEPPVKEFRLRAAGESSRQKITELNEQLNENIALFVVIPIAMAFTHYIRQSTLGGTSSAGWWVFALLSFFAVFWRGRVAFRGLKNLRNFELGCAGEQLVAEHLLPLARHGYLIFHDCPADQHGNIDHIVVTPSAVYAIETKSRRKRPSPDPERSSAEVNYDGCALAFPNSREDFCLKQARRQARWLADLLSKALADTVEVQPVLTLPGWMVRRKGRGDVAVVNPKELPELIREKSNAVPSDAALRRMRQIEFVLDTRCRDVAFGGGADAEATKAAKTPRPLGTPRPRAASATKLRQVKI